MTLMIVPFSAKDAAESERENAAKNNGPAFICRLSVTGQEPATHVACCGKLKQEEKDKFNAPQGSVVFDYDPVLNPGGARAAILSDGFRRITREP